MSTETSSSTPKSSNHRKKPKRSRGKPKPKIHRPTQKSDLESEADKFWEISGIVNERRQNGRLEYLVEWKDIEESTGRPYKPTWEPEENITEDALADWQREERAATPARSDAHLSQFWSSPFEVSTQQSEAVPPPKTTYKRRLKSGDVFQPGTTGVEEGARKRRRAKHRYIALESQDLDEQLSSHLVDDNSRELTLSIGHGATGPNIGRLVVELPPDPRFDRSEYQQVSLSQSTQGTEIAAQGDESHPEESPRFGERFVNHSNRTIPDSQEVSGNSISDTANSGPHVHVDPSIESQRDTDLVDTDHYFSQSGVRSIADSSCSVAEISSHQPEYPAANEPTHVESALDFIQETLSGSIESSIQTPHTSVINSPEPSQGPELAPVDPGFLTQLPIDLDDNASPSSSATFGANDSLSEVSVAPRNSTQPSQAAQIVPNSISQSEPIQTQSRSERDFSVYNDEIDFVPTTLRSQPEGSQISSQALSEVDVNTRISSSVAVSHESSLHELSGKRSSSEYITGKASGDTGADKVEVHQFTSGPHHAVNLSSQSAHRSQQRRLDTPITPINNMESASTSSTPLTMSARERLRQIQEQNFAQLNLELTLDVNLDAPTAGTSSVQVPLADSSFSNVPQPEQPVDLSAPLISPSLLIPSVEEEDHNTVPTTLHSDNAPHLRGQSFNDTTVETSYEAPPEDQPATLDPSALTLSIENDSIDNDMSGSPSIPSDDDHVPSLVDHDDLEVLSSHAQPQVYERSLLQYIKSGPNEHLVTLPLASNIRPQYTEIIQESKTDLEIYSAAFAGKPYKTPEPALIAKVDDMFTRLFDICDLPPFLEALTSIPPEGVTKHIRGTNSKFAFVGQFLEHLRNARSEKKVLILARPGQIVDLLNNLVKTEGYQGVQTAAESAVQHPPAVIVASTSDDLSRLPAEFDVVIAYDHTFRQDLLQPRDGGIQPIILTLITSTSVQHISMHISDTVEAPLERKNVLLLALCSSINAMENPEPGFAQPHEIAEMFAHYVEVPEDDYFDWVPQELPEVICDTINLSSQADSIPSSVGVNGTMEPIANRKRSFDEADETSVKRPRLAPPEVATTASTRFVSNSIRGLIGDDEAADQGKPTVEMSAIKAEETSAAKIARLEAELEKAQSQRDEFRKLADQKERLVDSWSESVNKIQRKYMASLKDRGTFEKERNAARIEAKTLSAQLESRRSEIKGLKDINDELKQKLSEAKESLINSTNPDLARMASLEKERDEANVKIAALEKKLLLAQNDTGYAREQYQIASHAAGELKKETEELKSQVVELTRKADDNIVLINKTQSLSEVRELVRLLAEQKSIVREREAELNRVKEQLSSTKNGRRETRQSSVPRSPRLGSLGIMSPRNPGRPAGAGPGPGAGISGAASRGTSPGPLGVFDTVGGAGVGMISGVGSRFIGQQQGSGRYSHLRD